MNWITIAWSVVIGACVAMALPQVLIWIWQRRIVHLIFVILTAAVVALLSNELVLMHASSVEQFARALQWRQLPLFVMFTATVVFVRLYFGTGRWWLGIAVCGLRFTCLVINFAFPPNLYFREITILRPAHLLGDTVLAAVGVASPWSYLTDLSSLFLLAFVLDASISLWQTGKPEARRRALIIGGSIASYDVLAAGLGTLIHLRSMPALGYLLDLPFAVIVAAMTFELSYDLFAALRISQELQISQASLRESEARINLAADAAHLGLWHWNIRDNELWVTEKWRKLFGITDSEPMTLDRLLQVVHPEDRERMKQVAQDVVKHRGSDHESEYRITLPDGSTRWIAGYGSIEVDERGEPAFARGVSRDITKRKVAEEELRESEVRFRTVADAAPVLIWMSGPDKLCTFFNKGWLDFTGRKLEQEVGNGWAQGVYQEDLDYCLDVYGKSFNARQSFTMEYRLRRNDGEYRWVLDSGTPRFAHDGVFLGYIGSCIDITERKQAELDHQLQNMELARVGRVVLMGELAASLAHEVNNPIGAMVANANAGQRLIARGNVETKELNELLADIVADGHRAREVIEDIRNMVRKKETTHALVRVDEIIRDLLRIVKADALTRKVTMTTEIDSEAVSVMANRVQLLQVLLNLTLNAFEAVSVNRPEARRLIITGGRDGEGEIVISLRDSGPGFPGGIVDQLFEPFFSTKAEGTGMGLAIAHSIIKAHGGTLTGENCDGGGACFTVRLPQAKQGNSKPPSSGCEEKARPQRKLTGRVT
jgi:PAS domain S-box-containing protein